MKVLIIEDEAAAARRLQKLIQDIDPAIEVVAQLDSIETTMEWLGVHELPELIFMDIHLADGSSFEIFHYVKINRPVIFTTAYDQYAIQAFKVNAIDYLLKPIKQNELEQAIEKYKQWKSNAFFDYQQLAKAMQQENQPRRLLIKLGQTIRVVNMNEAAYFYTENKITFVVTQEGKRYPLDFSLEKVEELVDDKSFFRINRQFIVNIQSIKEMYAYSKSRVKLELVPPCDLDTVVSTERSPVFKRWLQGGAETSE